MMIRCLAIDDEPLALRQLEGYLQRVPFFEVVGSCPSALKAMRIMEETAVDAVFIDINMPDLNGLDFVRSMKNPPLVVFTTAYSEFALEGYEVEAVDYLLKPFGMGRVMAAANKVRHRYELTHRQEAAPQPAQDDGVLFIKAEHRVVRVMVSEILYVEGMAEYLRVYTDGASKPLITLQRMKNMEETLQKYNFARIHRSYIINMNRVAEVNKTRVMLDTGQQIPIGDSYRDALDNYVAGKSL